MTTFLLILTTNLIGLCATLGYLVWMWRERALKAEAWRQLVSDKGTDYIAIKATGESILIERPAPPETTDGGYKTGRQRMEAKFKRREFEAVPANSVVAGLSKEDEEHLSG